MSALRRARTRRPRSLSALLALAAAIAVLVAAPPAAAAAELDVDVYSPTVISPNGDGYDDEVELEACAETTGTVTTTVRDAAGTVVRALGTRTLDYAGDCVYPTWYGTDDEDADVPDGEYVVVLTAALATGAASASLDVTVDRRLPGTLTAPRAATELGAETELEFTATEGFEIERVELTLGSEDDRESCTAPALRIGDSAVWRGTMATGGCGAGAVEAGAAVSWIDSRGDDHHYRTVPVPVTLPEGPLRAVLHTPTPVFFPNGDDQDDSVEVRYCAVGGAAGGRAAVTLTVVDQAGRVLRTLVDEEVPTVGSCGRNGGTYRSAYWDGRDDEDADVPDGTYELRLRAASPDGVEDVVAGHVSVDRRPPGTISSPESGATGPDTVLAFTPTAGFDIGYVEFALRGPSGTCYGVADRGDDGVWTTTRDEMDEGCGDGPWQVRADVEWYDAAGGDHYYRAYGVDATDTVVLVGGGHLIAATGDYDEVEATWCVTHPDPDARLHVVAEVLDPSGGLVHRLSDSYRRPDSIDDLWWQDCSYDSWYGRDDDGEPVPDGTYTVRVTVTPPDGPAYSGSRELRVDRRPVGILSGPLEGSYAPEQLDFVFEPTDGFDIVSVEFLASATDCPDLTATASAAAPDGRWQASIPVSDCHGQASTRARVVWADPEGRERTTYVGGPWVYVGTAYVSVNLWPDVLSPNGDEYRDVVSLSVCAHDPTGHAATRRVVARVVDAEGTVVRPLVDGTLGWGTTTACAPSLTWDGTDAEGGPLPDGDYRVEAVLHKGAAVADTRSAKLRLDRVDPPPGRFLEPVVGSRHDDAVTVVFEPAAGSDARQVRVSGYACGGSGSAEEPDEDGRYRFEFELGRCYGTRELQPVNLSVSWQTGTGEYEYWDLERAVRVPRSPEVGAFSPATTSFSPNGDGQEDEVGFRTCVVDATDGGDLSGELVIRDEAGQAVASYPTPTLAPRDYCGSGTAEGVVWDGRTGDGGDAPDGTYTAELTVTDATGLGDTAATSFLLDRRLPGEVVEPAAGASAAGAVQLGFRATDGVEVDYLTFEVAPSDGTACTSGYVFGPDLDGVWRAPLDTVAARCGDGARVLRAVVSWTDPLGGSHQTRTAGSALTLTNPARAPEAGISTAARVFSPDADGNDDSLTFYYCVRDDQHAGRPDVVVTVLDARGDVVRSLVDGKVGASYPSCSSWSGAWDGADDAGQQVPDGQYRLRIHATDPSGLTSVATTAVILVDRRVPGVVTSPTGGAELTGTASLVLTPTAGVAVTGVSYALVAVRSSGEVTTCSAGVQSAGDDRTWTAALDTTTCGTGRRLLRTWVSWRDSLGGYHYYAAPPVEVRLPGGAPVLSLAYGEARAFSPNGDGFEDTYAQGWCVLDDAEEGDVEVRAAVADASGETVRVLVDRAVEPGAACHVGGTGHLEWDGKRSNGTQAADGAYALVVTATDPSGLTTAIKTELAIDRRVPGAVTAPVTDDLLEGTTSLVFTPTAGFELSEMWARLSTWRETVSGTSRSARSDGAWRVDLPVGQLTSGPASAHIQVQWVDQFGASHTWYSPDVQVRIDSTSLPLSVGLWSMEGAEAPFTARLGVDTSDARSGTVTVRTDWGDGSAVEQTTLEAPYEPLVLPHSYALGGTYTVTVTATNERGGTATRTTRVVAAPRLEPNEPPTVQVTSTPTTGSAPLVTTTTLAATDPDGDVLSYTIDHGDGTPVVTGTLPTAPVTHTYRVGGSYVIRTAITDGRATVIRFSSVTVALAEPLRADAGDDLGAPVGEQVVLDASASRPLLGITRYHWDFGDGTQGTGASVRHAYDEPGVYRARLTVYAGQASHQDETTVTVSAPPAQGGLRVLVRDDEGRSVVGADVLVQGADGVAVRAATDGQGTARLHGLADGNHTVYAAAGGLLPGTTSAQVTAGSGEAVITLERGDVVAATLEAEPMSYDEIVEAGIDPDDPDNQHVVEFEVRLDLGSTSTTFGGYTSWGSGSAGYVGCPSFDGVHADCGQDRPARACTILASDYRVCVLPTSVGGQPQLTWLVLPAEASWLKEMFRVTMVVQNLARGSDFVLDNGSATLQLPPGLSLAPMTTPQQVTRTVAAIRAGDSAQVEWYLRGDAEGDYDLSASYAGTLQPTGTPVSVLAELAEPLHVWGSSAVAIRVEADEAAFGEWRSGVMAGSDGDSGVYPFHVSVSLDNVSDVPIYNLSLGVSDEARDGFVFQPEQVMDARVSELGPGESLTHEFVVLASAPGAVELGNSFVVRAAGERNVADTVTTRPRELPVDDVPTLRVLRGDDKLLVTMAPVSGATAYRFWTIDGPREEFVRVPPSAVHPVAATAAGELRYYLDDVDPDAHLAVTSVTGGVPRLVHAVTRPSTTDNRVAVRASYDTASGTPDACYTPANQGHGEIGDPLVAVGLVFEDGFGLETVSYSVDGVQHGPFPAGGATSYAVAESIRLDLGDVASHELRWSATNLAGDRMDTTGTTVDRDCAVQKGVVVAMGLNSSLKRGEKPTSVVPEDCGEGRERGDAWLEQAATNGCDAGVPNRHPRGNLVSYLGSKGYDAQDSRNAAARTLLEFSYEGADVVCPVDGAPSFLPRDYESSRTVTELTGQVLRKTNDTARSYFAALARYDSCWRERFGERLEFTVLGHSLGGYETLGLLKAAKDYRGEFTLPGQSGREDLISAAVSMDGALQPEFVLLQLRAGTCLTSGIGAGILDSIQDGLEVPNVVLTVAGLVNYAHGPNWASDIIRGAQQAGIRVATLTNTEDECLYQAATLNYAADDTVAYTVDVGGSGQDGHSALLTRHDAPIEQSGYPVTGIIDQYLRHSHGTLREPVRALRALRGAAATGGGGGIAGTLVHGGAPAYAEVVAISDQVSESATTDENGRFALAGLPAGSYRLYVNPAVSTAAAGWIGGPDRAGATVYQVVDGTVDAGTLTLAPAERTTLTLVDAQGAALSRAGLTVSDGDRVVAAVAADGAGRAVLPTGLRDDLIVTGADLSGLMGTASVGQVRAAGWRLRLTPTPSVQVRLLDDAGRPLAGITAAVRRGGRLVSYGITDEQGRYTFLGLPEGTVSVGLADDSPAGAAYEEVSLHAEAEVGDPADHAVTHQAGEELQAPTFGRHAIADGVVGEAYSGTVSTIGTPTPELTLATGQLPPGLALSADGRVTGAPTTSGTYTFTVTASSKAGVATSAPIALRVAGRPVQPPPSGDGQPPSAPPTLSVRTQPAIKGKAVVGAKLRLQPGIFAPSGATTSYQWLAGGKIVKRATGTTLKLKRRHQGKRIAVRVTVTLPGYAPLTVTTAATKKVKPPRRR